MMIAKNISLERRRFLGALGAGAGVAALAAGSLDAQTPATAQKTHDKNAAPLKIIDFHNHYTGPRLTLTTWPLCRPRRSSIGKASIASLRIRPR